MLKSYPPRDLAIRNHISVPGMLARIGKNFGAKLVGLAISFVDRFLVVMVLLRGWGTDVFAEWAILMAVAGSFALAEMGLNIYFGNVWQQHRASLDHAAFQRTLGVAITWGFALACGTLLILIVGLTLLDVPSVFAIKMIPREQSQVILVLLSAASISRSARGAISQLYRGRQQYALGTLVDQVQFAALAVSTLVAASLGATPLVQAVVVLISDLVAGWGVMIRDLKQRFPDLTFRPQLPTSAEVVEIAHHVKWLVLQQGIPVAWQQAPVLVLGLMGIGGTPLVGFIILRTLVTFARQIVMMFSLSAAVELADALHNGRREAVVRNVEHSAVLMSVLLSIIGVGIAVLGASFVTLWTGRADLFDLSISLYLLAGAAAAVPSIPVTSLLTLANMPRPGAIAQVVQLAFGLAGLLLLSWKFGTAGAAAGLAVGDIVAFCIALPLLAHSVTGWFEPVPYLARCYWAMILSAIWCSLVVTTLVYLVGVTSVASFLVVGLLYAVLGAAPAGVVGLPAELRRSIIGRLRQQRVASRP